MDIKPDLMARISSQLDEAMSTLVEHVGYVEHCIRTGEEIREESETLIQQAAGEVASAVGALRALAEVCRAEDEGSDKNYDDDPTGAERPGGVHGQYDDD